MYLENDAAGILKTGLDLLNGKTLNAAQAQNSFDSSLVNMGDHVNATGKKITFTTTSIKDMSSASVALRGQLNGQVTNLQNVVEANGGLANSTGKARAQMVTMRQQIIDNAVAHGVDRAAVTAYIDKLLKVPKSVPPTKLDVDTAAANAKIAAIKKLIATIPEKRTISLYVAGGASAAQAIAAINGINKRAGMAAGRAHGGPVTAGTPYVVGERRPELFVPDQNGTIIPQVPAPAAMGGFNRAGQAGQSGPLVYVERVVQGTPQDIGHEVSWAMAGRT
jgi:predicted ester cyclase